MVILIGLIVLALLPMAVAQATPTPAPSLQPTPTPTPPRAQAYGWKWVPVTMADAVIETADPQIRDGGWSWVRVFASHQVYKDHNWFAEIGWEKTADGKFWVLCTWQSSGGYDKEHFQRSDIRNPISHSYRVKHKGGGTGRWKFYYDDMSSPITTRWTGFDTGNVVGSGGEASSPQNAIGVSGCLNNRYRDEHKVEHPYMYDDPVIVPPGEYYVVPWAPNNWQVYGHNE